MSIASEITRLQGVKSDILQAIADKGVTVPAGSALDDCPALIASIGYDVIGGKKYKTVQMPDGKIWLAENLDFKFCDITSSWSTDNERPAACYYNNDESTYGWNGYKCGLLYNWYAAKVLNDHRSELCPGWHVPSQSDYADLKSLISINPGYKLSKGELSWATQWEGSDDFGFSMIPGGQFNANVFTSISIQCVFRVIEYNYYVGRTYESGENPNELTIGTISNNPEFPRYSLRLVRDT